MRSRRGNLARTHPSHSRGSELETPAHPALGSRIGENRRVRAKKPGKTIPRWQFAWEHAATWQTRAERFQAPLIDVHRNPQCQFCQTGIRSMHNVTCKQSPSGGGTDGINASIAQRWQLDQALPAVGAGMHGLQRELWRVCAGILPGSGHTRTRSPFGKSGRFRRIWRRGLQRGLPRRCLPGNRMRRRGTAGAPHHVLA